uniref:HAT C-terminal dimerisation domain-containing protein n=1 Tax=Kalanchoe fedtschenkoi TaxID=63787 RepID=A0A7N0T6M0_KALFE
MSKIHRQGYDGANNMKGEINGLQTLIMNNTPSAYYIHYTHQLQLTIVVVVEDNFDRTWLFEKLSYLLSMTRVFCNSKEMNRGIQAQKVAKALNLSEIKNGKKIRSRAYLYPEITKVLVTIGKSASNKEDHQLRNNLQKKDQDIINAMTRVSLTKEQLQSLRKDGWENFLNMVISFYKNHEIEMRRFFKKVKNIHQLRVEIFLSVIDLQLQELNNRFDQANMELFICMASLNPASFFAAFDKQNILILIEFYPNDFIKVGLMKLDFQLQMYVIDLSNDVIFQQVKDLGGLSCMLVETNKHKTYTYVYLLLKLVLILPMTTSSVERVFSTKSFVERMLKNSMSDQLLIDSSVTFIEKDIFS